MLKYNSTRKEEKFNYIRKIYYRKRNMFERSLSKKFQKNAVKILKKYCSKKVNKEKLRKDTKKIAKMSKKILPKNREKAANRLINNQ